MIKENLLFDLDGVIRWLTYTVNKGIEPTYYNQPLQNGLMIIEHFDKNPHDLFSAPPTNYYPIIKLLPRVNIISWQPENWKAMTTAWIYKYFTPQQVNIIYVDTPTDKFNYLSKDGLLVEDYPLFADNSQIIMIDRPYNQTVKDAKLRIKTPLALLDFLTTKNLI